ncbi:MAG: carbohydrate ABC transporter substrate-binding protein, partial [Treponema sp.]|nr:carbohydrate ABC transporter substrate-binding protein [Treponema sp.]
SGQNPYEKFAAISKKVNGSLDQSSDQMIESIFREAVMQYADGEKSKKKALRDFAKQVEMQLGIRSN